MNLRMILGWSSAFCLSVSTLGAQETNEVKRLKQELQSLQQSFQKTQELQRQQIEALERKLEEVQKNLAAQPTPPRAPEPHPQPPADPLVRQPWSPTDPLRLQRGPAYLDLSLTGTFAAGSSTAEDIEGGLQLGGHDPIQRGFTVQAVEANFRGAVDPYFRGNATVLFQIDAGGESFLELEEAYLETLSLPANLQLRAGQYYTEFGRHNPLHIHSWAFVDQPLVIGRLLGPDGLRNPGARLSWLTPTPFYSELFFGVQNSQGGTAAGFRSRGGHSHGGEEEEEELPLAFRHADNDRGVRGVDDLLLSARYAASWEVTDTQTLLAGFSGAWGPNASGSSGETRTEIYGADLTWRWRAARHEKGFPFVTWQSEALWRRYDVGAFDWSTEDFDADLDGNPDAGIVVDPATGLMPAVLGRERLCDYGFYSQLLYGFRPGWVAGVRWDYLESERGAYEQRGLALADGAGGTDPLGRDPFRARRWRVSPNLTWLPSEFSKVRLQYNYDDRTGFGIDHSVWLQFEFVLGAHGAHQF